MKVSRRTFLRAASGVSLTSLTGCDVLPALGLAPPPFPDTGPFLAPREAAKDGVSHVLGRLSYGPRPGDYARVKAMGVDAYIDEQLAPEALDDDYCDWMLRRCQTIRYPVGELFEYRDHLLLNDLTRATVLRAVYSKRQLYEVMAGFWSDHFNIDSSKGDCRWLKTADDRDVIRCHALGTFSELLRASALSPAMLWYLDGRENRRTGNGDLPNENYARELLELHTLGAHGGYTQKDVMEAARCLTGWAVRSDKGFGKGKVEFKPHLHDNGEKTVMGRRIPAGQNKKDLDQLLDIVTRHPSTAKHIATKLCRRFISEEPATASIDTVAHVFSRSDGDIRETLRALFATDEFANVRDTKLKRPFRFVVSALRATGASTDASEKVLDYFIRMGQAPFQYPTPDGYPEEASPWLGTMFWRWHFAADLARDRIGETRIDWAALAENFDSERGLMAHLLARAPTVEEEQAYHASGQGPALLLASPAFQRF